MYAIHNINNVTIPKSEFSDYTKESEQFFRSIC